MGVARVAAAAPAAAGDEWRRTARADYAWMAKEFNRQYINSHGKEHDDYQAHSVADELQLHYLNGRLWCAGPRPSGGRGIGGRRAGRAIGAAH